jgi:hypothetical protein
MSCDGSISVNVDATRHDAVRDMELNFLFNHWDELRTSSELSQMMSAVANGEMPHAGRVLVMLMAKMSVH